MADFIFRKSFQCTRRKTLRNYTSRQESTLNSRIVFRSIDLIAQHINREFDLQDEGPKSTVLEPFWFFSPVTLQYNGPYHTPFPVLWLWVYDMRKQSTLFDFGCAILGILNWGYSTVYVCTFAVCYLSCQPHVPQRPQHGQLDATKFSAP